MSEPKHRKQSSGVLVSNKFYDVMKFIALVLLPASGALYFGVAEIWGLPRAQEVVGTIAVVDTFLGVVLGLAKQRYDEDPNTPS